MLLQFSFSNFRSFANEIVFDMTAAPIKEHRYSLINKNGVDILPVSALYGANASGKSSFFMALQKMQSVVVSNIISNEDNNEKSLNFLTNPFMFKDNYEDTPTQFEVVLLIDEYKYRYGFECTQKKILNEYLFKQKISKYRTSEKMIFFRDSEKTTIDLGSVNSNLKKEIQYCFSMCVDKSLLLTDSGKREKNQELSNIYRWFCNIGIFLSNSQETFTNAALIEKLLGSCLVLEDNFHQEIMKKIISFTHEIDPSIVSFIKSEKSSFNGDKYPIALSHHIVNGVSYDVPLSIESEGTKKIIFIALVVFSSLENNYPVFFDELDSKLHPLLLRRLIQLYTNKETNPKGAQLIFSAHNIINLDSSDLRRDEIWFLEKENCISSLYSLVDFKDEEGGVRSDLNYGKSYLCGRFGAVPFQENEE